MRQWVMAALPVTDPAADPVFNPDDGLAKTVVGFVQANRSIAVPIESPRWKAVIDADDIRAE